ncbi:hypothetical protein KO317_02530 [Candidatus Micrarchaeota archaeon]|jgi:hypothetical protein|nr:hypothetical protein [Candidatus Micrarchaeota archaeon]
MRFSLNPKKDKACENVLEYILYGNLNSKEFPIEHETNILLRKITNNLTTLGDLNNKLNLDKMDTSIEILYALKKEVRGREYV